MGNYSELFFTDTPHPPERGALDASPDPMLSVKNHLPLLWLALFQAKDIVDLPEDEDGQSWPYLAKPVADALPLLVAREAAIQNAFPALDPVWLDQFKAMLQAASARFVHVDTRDLGCLLDSEEEWRQELALMLGIFEAPRPASQEWAAFDRQLGANFEGLRARDAWRYCGSSGGLGKLAWE